MRGFKRYFMFRYYLVKFRFKILMGIIFILALLVYPLLAVITGFFALGFTLLITAIVSEERKKIKKDVQPQPKYDETCYKFNLDKLDTELHKIHTKEAKIEAEINQYKLPKKEVNEIKDAIALLVVFGMIIVFAVEILIHCL